MDPLDEAYDVYINGKLVGRLGHREPEPLGISPHAACAEAEIQTISALTAQPAAAIAQAAQQWGQEDDITVLTVARLAPASA